MATAPSLFHAFLRPTILQILRATGYHSTRPAVLDSFTDLAARYLCVLCENTARHAVHNHGDSTDFDVTDVRLALEDAGALLPQRLPAEETWRGSEDLRGLEEFIKWFAGQRMKEMITIGAGDGETDATDYLNGTSQPTYLPEALFPGNT
jgi:transcription initiation factor TFIID subunit 3